MSSGRSDAPHLPQAVPIDAYGNGGFRFGGLSHRGSLLCLPQGMWAWKVARPEQIDAKALAGVIAAAASIDTLLIGAGPRHLAAVEGPARRVPQLPHRDRRDADAARDQDVQHHGRRASTCRRRPDRDAMIAMP